MLMVKQQVYHYEVYCITCGTTTVHRVTVAVTSFRNVVVSKSCLKCGAKEVQVD
jgi:transcription elongation factor Elf1